MKNPRAKDGANPSQRISQHIAELGDWRGATLGKLRKLILEASPGITEEWKWNSPVWSQNGLVCSASPFKDHVKLNFFQGASLADPKHLLNAGLEAKVTRAIDFGEGDKVDDAALKDLVRAAVAHNASGGKGR
jgi:hypothetical protein